MIHPLWVRITHWINALAMVVMIGSGWEIYNASPLFPFAYSRERSRSAAGSQARCSGTSPRCGCWPSMASSIWCSASRPAASAASSCRSGRARWSRTPRAALTGRLAHDDLSVYNAVQKLLYLGVIVAGIVIVLSGLAIWKPVQLQELTALFGGYDAARYVHFFAMAAIVGFLVIHVVMAFVVPKSLRAMITGR